MAKSSRKSRADWPPLTRMLLNRQVETRLIYMDGPLRYAEPDSFMQTSSAKYQNAQLVVAQFQ
jgi:hypothetical protein